MDPFKYLAERHGYHDARASVAAPGVAVRAVNALLVNLATERCTAARRVQRQLDVVGRDAHAVIAGDVAHSFAPGEIAAAMAEVQVFDLVLHELVELAQALRDGADTPPVGEVLGSERVEWAAANMLGQLAAQGRLNPETIQAPAEQRLTAQELLAAAAAAAVLTLADCTHGAECRVHPYANGVHNYDTRPQ